jgi:hypothetical protein
MYIQMKRVRGFINIDKLQFYTMDVHLVLCIHCCNNEYLRQFVKPTTRPQENIPQINADVHARPELIATCDTCHGPYRQETARPLWLGDSFVRHFV